MTKEEINYMMKNGFSISEIMEMEKPLENLTKEDEATNDEVVIPVESEKATTDEAGVNKKKVSSDSSEDILNHIKHLEETIKTLQDSNRQNVTIEAPEEYTAEQAIKDLFEEVK